MEGMGWARWSACFVPCVVAPKKDPFRVFSYRSPSLPHAESIAFMAVARLGQLSDSWGLCAWKHPPLY